MDAEGEVTLPRTLCSPCGAGKGTNFSASSTQHLGSSWSNPRRWLRRDAARVPPAERCRILLPLGKKLTCVPKQGGY